MGWINKDPTGPDPLWRIKLIFFLKWQMRHATFKKKNPCTHKHKVENNVEAPLSQGYICWQVEGAEHYKHNAML